MDKKEIRKRYFKNYRLRYPEKIKARSYVHLLEKQGYIIRPEECQECGCKPGLLSDGRSGLRMDHYKGYDRQFWGAVRFICVKCDQKNINKNRLTY